MRIYMQTTANNQIVPFDYQGKLIGSLHKWLGSNDLHDRISLYSFSWLLNGIKVDNGYTFKNGAKWFISFYDDAHIRAIVKTIQSDPQMFCGLQVTDIAIQEAIPNFSNQEYFKLASPIFIKRRVGEKEIRYYNFNDREANQYMVETLKHKMEIAGLPDDDTLDIRFDLSYQKKKIKKVNIHGLEIKCNMCPVIMKGKIETKAFAWKVGLGNATGSSLGALY